MRKHVCQNQKLAKLNRNKMEMAKAQSDNNSFSEIPRNNTRNKCLYQ